MSLLQTLATLAHASPEKWAYRTFGSTHLGDQRRTDRMVRMASAWAGCPAGSLPEQGADPAALKATYRLLHNDALSFAQVLAPHQQQTRQLAQQAPVVLLVQDTTEFDFSRHRATVGLAPIGDGRGRGFHLQTVLAVTPQRLPLGVLAARPWTRHPAPAPDETRVQRAQRPRESDIWGSLIRDIGPPPAGQTWVHVADRGADCYSFFAAAAQTGSAVLVRVVQNRCTRTEEGEPDHLLDLMRGQPARASRSLRLRARPGQAARTTTVAVSWVATTLQPPAIRDRRQPPPPPCPIWAVRVWEPDPPSGSEPLEWLLATTVAVESVDDAWERVDWYTTRWLIEELHQGLKTGCGAETTQLRDRDALWRRLAVLLPLAVRLLVLRALGRDQPAAPVSMVADATMVAVVAARTRQPPATTVGVFLRQVARLGGHQGRNGDGPPGWRTLWKGWLRVETLCEGVALSYELGII